MTDRSQISSSYPEMQEYMRVHRQLTDLGKAQQTLKWFPCLPEFARDDLQYSGIDGADHLAEDATAILNFINEARAQLREQEVPVFNAVQAPYFTENVA